MKLYSHFQFVYRGFQLDSFCIAKNKKEASKILDVTIYCMNNWVNTSDIKDEHKNLEPNKVYYRFDQFGGEVRYFLNKLEIKKIYTFEEIEEIIKKHRAKYPTYHNTIEQYK